MGSERAGTIELILSQGLLPLYFTSDADVALKLTEALIAGGVQAIEFTNRGEAAFEVFSTLRQAFPRLQLGIGTVLDAPTAEAYLAAGADFVLSPVNVPAAAQLCRAVGRPYIPGAQTVSEIWQAREQGAALIKVFPGEVLGPAFVRALLGPLPGTRLLVTGGVEATRDSLAGWFGAGVSAVGMGSRLIPAQADPAALGTLTERARQLLNWIAELRGEKPA